MKHVVTVHTVLGRSETSAPGFLSRKLLGWMFVRADAIVAVSEAVRQDLTSRFPEVSDKTHLILNGVDLERLLDRPARQAVAVRLGLSGDLPRIGVVARLSPEKGVDIFLRAAALMSLQGVEAECLVVGDGPERGRLERLAHRLGLTGQAHFVKAQREIAPLLAALDVLVVPSRSEAFSMVAVEAAMLGIPVVASRVGGLPEVLAKTPALFVEPENAEALASAIIESLRRAPVEQFTLELDDIPPGVASWAAGRLQQTGYDLTGDLMEFYLASGPGLESRVELAERFSASRMARETHQLYGRMLGISEGQASGG